MNREPHRQRTYFILLLVTAFALLTIDYHSNGPSSPLHPLEKLVAGVVGPGESAVSSLVKPLTDEVHFGKQPSQLAALQKQVDAAKSQAEQSQSDHRFVQQYTELMGLTPYYQDPMLPANVVATSDTVSDPNAITIDVGTRDKVHINMTVVTGSGLIGNVISVTATTSTVQLLTDPAMHVTVLNGRTNTTGIISGGGNGDLDLQQISQTSDIRVGDQIETRGSQDNQPFVAYVPVGVVISVNNNAGAATHTAVVRPFASFDQLDLVAVVFPTSAAKGPRKFIPPITPGPTTPAPTPSATAVAPSASVQPSGSGSATSGTPTSGTPTGAAPTSQVAATTTSAGATTAAATSTHPVTPTKTTPTKTSPSKTTPTKTTPGKVGKPTGRTTTPAGKPTTHKPPTTPTTPASKPPTTTPAPPVTTPAPPATPTP